MAVRKEVGKEAAARCQRASKGQKKIILDVLCALTGWQRDRARRALRAVATGPVGSGCQRPQRPAGWSVRNQPAETPPRALMTRGPGRRQQPLGRNPSLGLTVPTRSATSVATASPSSGSSGKSPQHPDSYPPPRRPTAHPYVPSRSSMEPPARCGGWLTPPPSPRRAAHRGQDTTRGAGALTGYQRGPRPGHLRGTLFMATDTRRSCEQATRGPSACRRPAGSWRLSAGCPGTAQRRSLL